MAEEHENASLELSSDVNFKPKFKSKKRKDEFEDVKPTKIISDKFVRPKSDKEATLRREAVGLVHLNEFQKIKKTISESKDDFKTEKKPKKEINAERLSFDHLEGDNADEQQRPKEGTSSEEKKETTEFKPTFKKRRKVDISKVASRVSSTSDKE
jgi:hypothetical protein